MSSTQPVRHLTLTGYWAGQPHCPIDKAEAEARGDTFVYAACAPTEWLERGNGTCEDCLDEWHSAECGDS